MNHTFDINFMLQDEFQKTNISDVLTIKPNTYNTVAMTMLSLLTVFANLGTMLAFWQDRTLRDKPSDLLILSLSFVDFLQGLIVMPMIIAVSYLVLGELGCQMSYLLGDIGLANSLLHLLAISVDRLLLISMEYPCYLKFQSRRRVKMTIAVCWIISVSVSSLEIGLWEFGKTLDPIFEEVDFKKICLSPARQIELYKFILVFVFSLLPVVLVTFMSLVFLCLLKKRLSRSRQVASSRVIQSEQNSSNRSGITESHPVSLQADHAETCVARVSSEVISTTNKLGTRRYSGGLKRRYIKPATTLGAFVLSMAICFSPSFFYVIFFDSMDLICVNCFVVLLFLAYCNPALDAILYAVTQSKIRRFYRMQLIRIRTRLF